MSETTEEYLAALRTMAQGALDALDQRDSEPTLQKSWWNGYRQALDDIGAFAGRNIDEKPDQGEVSGKSGLEPAQ